MAASQYPTAVSCERCESAIRAFQRLLSPMTSVDPNEVSNPTSQVIFRCGKTMFPNTGVSFLSFLTSGRDGWCPTLFHSKIGFVSGIFFSSLSVLLLVLLFVCNPDMARCLKTKAAMEKTVERLLARVAPASPVTLACLLNVKGL